MSSEDSSSSGSGRARGRARGRPPVTLPPQPVMEESGDIGESAAAASGGNGGNGGNGAAQRGRGGYRSEVYRTLPGHIRVTAGEGGTSGRVTSNFFRLITPQDVIVQMYHVEFQPQVESPRMRRALLLSHKESFGNAYVFDGMSNLKLIKRLTEDETVFTSVRRTDDAPIRITIKHVGEIPWGNFQMVQMYNTQMRRNLQHLKYVLVGNHFFDPRLRHKIPEHRLEMWQGILTAIAQHDGGVLMVCDTVFKVIRSDTVMDVLQEVLRRDRSTFKDNARKELAGSIVMTSYNNKTYKIDDIDFERNPMSEFPKGRENVMTSYFDYYKEQYNLTIRDQRQPLIKCLPSAREMRAMRQSGEPREIYLVPELCSMTGLTESLKNNQDLKKQMTGLARADPNKRVQNLGVFMQSMAGCEEVRTEMANWKLRFETNLIELPARILGCEKMYMQNDTDQSAQSFDQRSGDFTKQIRGKPLKSAVSIPEWVILVTGRDKGLVDDFAQTLNRVCGPMGIRLNRPQIQTLDNDRTGTFVDACKRVPEGVKMVVIIVPNNNKDRYDTIKKIFCCERPVASQVIVGRTISKKPMLMSVCTKIGIQMAVKLGAEAWAVNIPPKSLMVIGYDTHHDPTKARQSVGGFVCSLNATLTKWYSRVSYSKDREEMSNNFANNFASGLKQYHEVNGQLPERVIIYRDGVSDGQIPQVHEFEVAQIKKAMQDVAGSVHIRLAFVIVTKRINARFFNKTGERSYENPMPGTIIDTVVTRPERYDFYLISQSVRQGTVAPTMYNIIEDDTNWKPNHHQQLAYKLTHLYYNWPGTIRVPAPCQYAHKLAFLTGTSLHREPATSLSNTLFYL